MPHLKTSMSVGWFFPCQVVPPQLLNPGKYGIYEYIFPINPTLSSYAYLPNLDPTLCWWWLKPFFFSDTSNLVVACIFHVDVYPQIPNWRVCKTLCYSYICIYIYIYIHVIYMYIYIYYGCLIGFPFSHQLPEIPPSPRIAKAMTRKTKAKANSPTSVNTWPQTKTNAEILVPSPQSTQSTLGKPQWTPWRFHIVADHGPLVDDLPIKHACFL